MPLGAPGARSGGRSKVAITRTGLPSVVVPKRKPGLPWLPNTSLSWGSTLIGGPSEHVVPSSNRTVAIPEKGSEVPASSQLSTSQRLFEGLSGSASAWSSWA